MREVVPAMPIRQISSQSYRVSQAVGAELSQIASDLGLRNGAEVLQKALSCFLSVFGEELGIDVFGRRSLGRRASPNHASHFFQFSSDTASRFSQRTGFGEARLKT